jgi:hypothetical protein
MHCQRRYNWPRRTLTVPFTAALLIAAIPLSAQTVNVLTEQYGNRRQGYNNQESYLTSANISTSPPTVAPFSPLMVDLALLPGATTGTVNRVLAQPLYVPAVSSGLTNCNPSCNMVLVVTLGGGVYAFNAGDTTHSGGTGAGGLVWARNGQSTSGTDKTNYFWYDDCGQSGGISDTLYGGVSGNVSFAGILATPVIDTSGSTPLMYVTSLCETTTVVKQQHWFIHQIELNDGHDVATPQEITGAVPGSANADSQTTSCPTGVSSPCIPFEAWNAMQRPGLLEVSLQAVSYPLIYVALGFGAPQETTTPYHGWVFAYDNNLNQKLIFATNTKGGSTANTDTPACAGIPSGGGNSTCSCTDNQGGCSPNSGGSTDCPTCCIPSNGYLFSPNWCGHASGIWGGSGRAPAANTLNVSGSPVSNAYFGTTNGSFQQWQSDGTTLLSPNPYNWGESIVDFTFSSAGFGQVPSQYFTPYGGRAVQPPTGTEGGATANPVPYTFEGLNQNDYDMAVSGILLLDDPAGTPRLVTCDKAGYCYLLTQGNLCGDSANNPPQCYPGVSNGLPGLASGDPGDVFAFAGNLTQCPDQSASLPDQDDSCDRITSLAFNNAGSPRYLYLWPSYERLTGLQLSNGTNQLSGALPITWTTGSTTIQLNSACTSGTNCFTDEVVPGDTLTACGCTGTSCPIVTTVNSSGASITVSQAFPSTCTPPQSTWSYSGYFLNPIRDNRPAAAAVQDPGGSVEVTSNGGSDAVVWGLATVCLNSSSPCSSNAATLYAYDTSLDRLWCTNSLSYCDNSSSFNQARFALPTVANGYVYVPTSGVNLPAAPSSCLNYPNSSYCCVTSPSNQCGGVIVYTGH